MFCSITEIHAKGCQLHKKKCRRNCQFPMTKASWSNLCISTSISVFSENIFVFNALKNQDI